MKPILLFDLGDTLVRYYRREEFPPLLRSGIQAAREALSRWGHQLPSDFDVECRVASENYEAKNGRVRPLHKRLGRVFGVESLVSEKEWLPICRDFLAPIFSVARIYEDTLPTLDAFLSEGYRIGILSNCPWGAPSEPWFEELRRHGLSSRCEVVVFCSDVGWRKPARPMFRRALSHFRCKPEECLFVGDNPKWDMQGAKRANMIPVLVDRTGQTHTDTDLIIRSLLELKPIVDKLKRTRFS